MQTQTVAIPKFPVVQKSLHAELKRRVNQYLEEQTIRGTGNYKLFTKAVILISLFFITYIHLVFFTPPTAMPTMSPTTTEQMYAMRKKVRTRSWLLVTLFWVIVLCCFSLENGLCACRIGRRKEEYAGVELGSGGFD